MIHVDVAWVVPSCCCAIRDKARVQFVDNPVSSGMQEKPVHDNGGQCHVGASDRRMPVMRPLAASRRSVLDIDFVSAPNELNGTLSKGT